MEKLENENALKHMYNRAHLKRVATAIQSVHPAFSVREYCALEAQLGDLEMKPRVRFLRDELHRRLPGSFSSTLKILLRAMRQGDLEGFDLWPVTEWIQLHGTQDVEVSLAALREITQRFTSEWAVRPFLIQQEKRTLDFLLACARDPNEHVRRWASEGARPRLPWGERLHAFVKNPRATLPILELLKFDDALYVRKSVANHLNDIAKDHPDFVVEVLGRWQEQAGEAHALKIDWITHRALRTLIKDGHTGALALIGVAGSVQVELQKLRLEHSEVRVGEKLGFEFSLHSTGVAVPKLVVDYRIHFVRAQAELGLKVFKLKTLHLAPGETVRIQKAHSFKKITTRRYYPGEHTLEIQVNGKVLGKKKFQIKSGRSGV